MTPAEELKNIYINLNLGIRSTVGDTGDILYLETVPVDAPRVLFNLSKGAMSDEDKVKYLANLAGIINSEVEAILSNFSVMKTVRKQLFTEWLTKGRPDTYIIR